LAKRVKNGLSGRRLFVAPGDTLESVNKRQMFIEVLLVFPELAAGAKGSEKTVPASFRHMIVDGPGEMPFCPCSPGGDMAAFRDT